MKKIISILLIPFLLSSCAYHAKTTIENSSTSSLETKLGEAIHRQILQSMPVCHDEKLDAYVQSIGQNIARAANRKDLTYRFIIVEDIRIHATHAPGGYVYITTGFFRFLESEIELAGILAYEIAMLQYKDPRLSKAKKAIDFLIRSGTYVGPAFGTIGSLSVLGLAIIGSVTNTEKSLESQIRDADEKALRYLTESGYDPQGLIDPLRRMSDPESPYRAYLYDYLQSHPLSTKRFERLEEEFQKLPLVEKEFHSGRNEFLVATETARNSFVKK